MGELELLDSGAHATVRMTPPQRTYGPIVRVVASEVPAAAAAGPLFLTKHPETGAFYVGIVSAFREGEFLIDCPDDNPAFRPAEVDREGFFTADDNIALDPAHGRFGEAGEALFDEGASPSRALKRVQAALGRLATGVAPTDAFIAALLANRLIEPIDIALSFDDGETLRLDGLYTVSLDALAELPDAAALALVRAGHLQLAYILAQSLQHVALMARRRNARLTR